MNTLKCMQCGKDSPEHTFRFFAVNVSTSASGAGDRQAAAQEKLSGVEKLDICETCLAKGKKSHSITKLVVGLITGFVLFMIFFYFMFNYALNDAGTFGDSFWDIVLISLGFGVICAVVSFVSARKTNRAFLAAMILDKIKGSAVSGTKYIPAGRDAYLDKAGKLTEINFRKKSGLKTELAGELYRLISANRGDQLVDEILTQKTETDSEQPAVSAPLDDEELRQYAASLR